MTTGHTGEMAADPLGYGTGSGVSGRGMMGAMGPIPAMGGFGGYGAMGRYGGHGTMGQSLAPGAMSGAGGGAYQGGMNGFVGPHPHRRSHHSSLCLAF